MSALLETLKFRHEPLQGSTTTMEDHGTEGKFGIPRFNGEPTMLPEYVYRVRTRMARESKMSKDELEKLGPLGLRLVEGLRGSAVRMAQQLDIKVLSSKDGPEELIKVFNQTLKPRRAQEARELYSAGSREGGMLSRQVGESMASYVSRRRAWWSALQGLDSELKIPEVILAEQILVNSNITDDQKLMVRTMLQGTLTVENVAAELLSQHGTIHDKEKYRRGKGDGKPWRPRRFHGGKGYFAGEPDYEDGDWDSRSQSLTGYTAYEDDVMTRPTTLRRPTARIGRLSMTRMKKATSS